jgi:flagellar protein FlgJ
MLRLDALSGGAGLDSLAEPIRPAAGGKGFSSLFGELNAEISEFIQNGSSTGAGGGLTASGGLYRARAEASSMTENALASDAGQFVESIAPLAQEAGRKLGVSSDILAAQAALESGWGQRPLRRPDGSDSHNLFGLKAGSNWQGDSTLSGTTEYENGTAQAKTERFRTYPDKQAAFHDFANLLLSNPRYHAALNTGNDVRAYAQGLVRGGYATDPAYADKLVRVVNRLHSGD